jgi:hypothetical protein
MGFLERARHYAPPLSLAPKHFSRPVRLWLAKTPSALEFNSIVR